MGFDGLRAWIADSRLGRILARSNDSEPSQKELIAFFLPLAMTSFVVVITHSFFNAGLARLPNPEVLIAAFAVAKSLMWIIQSPLGMIRQTVTAMVDHRIHFKSVSLFLGGVTATVLLILGLIAFTDLSRWIFQRIMGLSGETLEQAVLLLRIISLFPVFASVRDFFAGFSIKFRTTPLITVASIARISYVLLIIVLIERLSFIPSAYLTGIMYIGAVAIEALIMIVGTRVTSRSILNGLNQIDRENTTAGRPVPAALTTLNLFSFFMPLTVTAMIQTSLGPIVNTGLARSSNPDMALAVYAVAWGLGSVVLSPLNTFHQVSLNFIRQDDPQRDMYRQRVRRFAQIIALTMAGLLILIAFTDLGYLILRHLIGTSDQISRQSEDVLKLMCVLPFMMITREYFWGILMQRRETRFIWKGKAINVITLISVVSLMTVVGPANPAINGAVGMIACELSELLYLLYTFRKSQSASAGTVTPTNNV